MRTGQNWQDFLRKYCDFNGSYLLHYTITEFRGFSLTLKFEIPDDCDYEEVPLEFLDNLCKEIEKNGYNNVIWNDFSANHDVYYVEIAGD